MKTLAIVTIFLWSVLFWPISEPREEYNRDHDPKYHGADVLRIGWKGEITALKWDGKKYRVMWVRRGKE